MEVLAARNIGSRCSVDLKMQSLGSSFLQNYSLAVTVVAVNLDVGQTGDWMRLALGGG